MGAGAPRRPTRSPEDTRKAADRYLLVAPVVAPLLEPFHGIRPVVPAPHEDSQELNKAYHEVRTRPFGWTDCGYPVCIFLPESEAELAGLVFKLNAGRALLDRHGVKVAVCGGAHGNKSMATDCITIDLQKIAYAIPDLERKRIRIGGGAKLGAATNALEGTGYAISTGTHTDTGVGGLTLAGGIGYLAPRCGLACDTLVRARVVLFDGRVVETTDTNEHKDLIRALRGGGGNFGIVTEFEFDIFPVDNAYFGAIVHVTPTEKSWKQTFRSLMEVLPKFSENEFCLIALDPTGPPVIANLISSVGDKQYKKKDGTAFKAVRAIEGPKFKLGFRVKLDFNRQMMRVAEPFSAKSFYCGSGWCIDEPSDEFLDDIYKLVTVKPPMPFGSLVGLAPFLNKMKTGIPDRPHSMGHRDKKFWFMCEVRWYDPKDEARCKKWHRSVMDVVRKAGITSTTSHNLPEPEGVVIDDTVAYGGPVKAFLANAKRVYDPNNFWQMNTNIKPAQS